MKKEYNQPKTDVKGSKIRVSILAVSGDGNPQVGGPTDGFDARKRDVVVDSDISASTLD